MDDLPSPLSGKLNEVSPASKMVIREGEHYGDVVLSLQAGPQRRCRRRGPETYPGDLRPYSHVEVALIGPDDALTIPSALGLPAELDLHFVAQASVPVAGPLPWRTVNELRRALIDRCERLRSFDPC